VTSWEITPSDTAGPYPDPMDELLQAFIEPAAWGGKGIDDREPPELATEYAARLVAVLVEGLGGTVTVTPSQLRSVPERLLLLIRQGEDVLEFETRPLAQASDPPGDIGH
jgi:hypothetical protein